MKELCKRCGRREYYLKKARLCKPCYYVLRYKKDPVFRKKARMAQKKWMAKVGWNTYMKNYYKDNPAQYEKMKEINKLAQRRKRKQNDKKTTKGKRRN